MTKLNKIQKSQVWSLILLADFDFSRIVIADYDLDGDHLTLWIEDRFNPMPAIDECVRLDIPVADFAKCIEVSALNTHIILQKHIKIDEPMNWYHNDANLSEQKEAREEMLAEIINALKSGEVAA